MQKIWLQKVALFFIVALLVISVSYKFIVINRVFYDVDYGLEERIDTLVVGASHLRLGFDDGKYPNVNNFSNSGMPYYFTYAKSKRLLDANPQIKKLVISLSPIHISPYGDSTLFTDEGLSRENTFIYFPLLEEYQGLGRRRISMDFALSYSKYKFGVPFNYMEDIKPFLSSIKSTVHFSDLEFGGNFSPATENKTDLEGIREKAYFYFGEKIYYSKLSVSALKGIAKLTENKSIDLYILNMPVYKAFRDLVPQEYVDEQNRLIAELLAQYQHIQYLDYYEFPLLEEDFYDGDHINSSGVEKLSKSIEKDVLSLEGQRQN